MYMYKCYVCYKYINMNDFSKTQINKGYKKKCKYCIKNKIKLKNKIKFNHKIDEQRSVALSKTFFGKMLL